MTHNAPESKSRAKEDHLNHGRLFELYLDEINEPPELDEQEIHFRFNRLFSTYVGACFFGMDPFSSDQPPRCRGEPTRRSPEDAWRWTHFWRSRFGCSTWRRSLKFAWLSYVVPLFYAGCIALVAPVIYQFYADDFARLKLDKLREWMAVYGPERPVPTHLASSGLASSERPMRELEASLLGRLTDKNNEQASESKLLANYGIILECSFLYMITLSFYVYFTPFMVYRWLSPFDFSIVRDFLDHKGELERIKRTCEREVRRFIRSSRVYYRCARGTSHFSSALDAPVRRCHLRKSVLAARPQLGDESGDTDEESARRGRLATRGDTKASLLAAEMLERGALVPPNKTRLWVDRRTRSLCLMHSTLALYVLMIDICGMLFAHIAIKPLFMSGSVSFLKMVCSAYALLVIVGVASCYLAPIFLIACLDQTRMAKRLVGLTERCISLNEMEFDRYLTIKSSSNARHNSHYERFYRPDLARVAERMNSNYLFILLTFKIFMVQLQSFKKSYRLAIPLSTAMAFLMPIFVRLHVPYFKSATQIDGRLFRLIAFGFSLTILLTNNLMLFPACTANRQSSKLYKTMSSLMAHLCVVRAEEPLLYDQFAVNVLMKELLSPDIFLDQFVMRSLGIPATYSSWLQFHFWWGLVGLSTLMDGEPSDRTFGSLFVDPLRVYAF